MMGGIIIMEDINALDEINKGALMGVNSISYILEKIEDKKLKKLLEDQLEGYKKISDRIEKVYSCYDKDGSPHKVNTIEKMMTYWSIEMKTMKEESDSKISELLIKGTNMGIIEGVKILNNKKLDKRVRDIAEEFISLGEEYNEKIKKFL